MKNNKVKKIINEEFDFRIGNVIVSYIMDKGMEFIKQITDEDINSIKENGIMSQNFLQSLVKCAKRICIECEWIEIIEFIRLHMCCTPTVHDLYLYREDFSEESFLEILNNLDLENEQVENELKLYAVVDTASLKEE